MLLGFDHVFARCASLRKLLNQIELSNEAKETI